MEKERERHWTLLNSTQQWVSAQYPCSLNVISLSNYDKSNGSHIEMWTWYKNQENIEYIKHSFPAAGDRNHGDNSNRVSAGRGVVLITWQAIWHRLAYRITVWVEFHQRPSKIWRLALRGGVVTWYTGQTLLEQQMSARILPLHRLVISVITVQTLPSVKFCRIDEKNKFDPLWYCRFELGLTRRVVNVQHVVCSKTQGKQAFVPEVVHEATPESR